MFIIAVKIIFKHFSATGVAIFVLFQLFCVLDTNVAKCENASSQAINKEFLEQFQS